MMQPPTIIPNGDGMQTEEGDYQEQETQQETQSTQQASQPRAEGLDAHLWGFLQPCSANLARIDFWKMQTSYSIGRNAENNINNIVLPGFKVSNRHCRITWDGKETATSSVIVHDLSSNGTFINGEKIGKGRAGIIREGNELAFGTSQPQPQNTFEDYRFVFRLVAGGPPLTGLHAFYDLGCELGKGSFATVMKAINRASGKWYAVKMIQESQMRRVNGNGSAGATNDTNGTTQRSNAFAREISILESLEHPNICQLKEVFFQDEAINLVLELIEGGDLLDHILKNNGLAESDAKHITYQICDAMSYIHSKGIAHRDLKPENVLLTTDNPPVVKVADFGLAKVVDNLTQLRTMCGTPSYLAPEVVLQKNQEGYDNVVDSWSVGVIVFSMLTNSTPFIEDENQRDIRTRIAERQVDWSTLTHSRVSQDAENFVRRLLEPRPDVRMSLTAALEHPWLRSYIPVYNGDRAFLPSSSNPSSSIAADVSMLSSFSVGDGISRNADEGSVSNALFNMQLERGVESDAAPGASQDSAAAMVDSLPGAFPNGRPTRREGSKPLQRRSNVISQMIEDGALTIEPSWEMIQNEARIQVNNAGPSVVRGNKRVHSELTPLPEEFDSEGEGVGDGDGDGEANGTRKRGKGESEEVEEGGGQRPVRGGKAGRGRGAAKNGAPKSARSRAVVDGAGENGDGPTKPPRRSTRTPNKVARRG